MTSAESPERSDLTVPLLYWAIVLAGLASLALLRTSADTRMLIPIWGGTIAGTAFGQLVARLRVRTWAVLVVLLPGMWFGSWVLLAVEGLLHNSAAWTALEAFLPAVLGGYFSLSNRGALSALWFPSVAWMLALLDGAGSGLTNGACAAIACTFGVLFLLFMRVRETRRVALWRTEAAVRLAADVSETVLARAPARIFSQATWFAGVGASALFVSAWVLPHLMQDEHALGGNGSTKASSGHAGNASGEARGEALCCDSQSPKYGAAQSSKPIEYFPTMNWNGGHESSAWRANNSKPTTHTSCTACVEMKAETVTTAPTTGYGYEGYSAGQATTDGVDNAPYVPGAYVPGTSYISESATVTTTNNTAQANTTVIPPLESATPVTHSAPVQQHPIPAAPAHVPAPQPTHIAAPDPAPTQTAPPTASQSSAPEAPLPPPPALTASRSTLRGPSAFLTLAALAVALHAFGRIARRAIVVRHLTRALWPESAAQRLSNHWQLLLMGLRDAGWEPLPDEQPHALARRVGIDEVATCATLLERARHGLRIEAEDLTAMQTAAQSVYKQARAAAGWSARTLSWLRPI